MLDSSTLRLKSKSDEEFPIVILVSGHLVVYPVSTAVFTLHIRVRFEFSSACDLQSSIFITILMSGGSQEYLIYLVWLSSLLKRLGKRSISRSGRHL